MTTPRETVEGVLALMEQRRADLERLEDANVAMKNILDSLGNDADADMAALRAIDWGDGPAPAPDPPPPPVQALIGSGYNTVDNDVSINDVPGVEKWRKRPMSAYLVLQWGHKGWDVFRAAYTKPGWPPYKQIPILAKNKIIPVMRIPFLVDDGNDLNAAMRGDYDRYHIPCADWIASFDWQTEIVVSGNKECDQKGLPYYYGDTPAQRAKWWQATARIANIYADRIGAKHPGKVRFAFCVTKRTPEAEWQAAIPDLSLVKCPIIKAPDIYLNQPGIDTAASFKDNVLRFAEPKIEWAKKNGLQFGIPEWAITKMDQPGNVQRWLDYLYALGPAFIRFEHYYGTGPAHALYGKTPYPKSAAAYVEWMQGRQS